jgi:hypothetical protein
MNDTLRLQGDAVSKLHGQGESTLRLRDGVVHQLQTLTEDSVALSGVFTDRATAVQGDGVALGDVVFGGVTRRSTVTEKLRLGDAIIIRGKSLVDDSIALADGTTHAVKARTTDAATFSDQVLGQRRVVQLVVDGIRLGDAAPRIARELVTEAFVVGEAYSGKLCATDFFSDSLALAAEDDTTTTKASVTSSRAMRGAASPRRMPSTTSCTTRRWPNTWSEKVAASVVRALTACVVPSARAMLSSTRLLPLMMMASPRRNFSVTVLRRVTPPKTTSPRATPSPCTAVARSVNTPDRATLSSVSVCS